ncbi:MAG: FG-GAP-like repeat-containing protein, partial [Polyangiaceae bacterium]
AATDGSSAVLAACDPTSNLQEWDLRTDGTVRLVNGGRCLAAVGGAPTAPLTVRNCVANSAEQQFLLTGQAQLRGPNATCVKATGTALSIQNCANDSNMLQWSMQFHPAVFTGITTGYTDAAIPNNAAYFGTIDFADVDGDGDGDVCSRRAGGIYCAMYNPGTKTFTGDALRIAQFRDVDGYNLPQYGSTVQLGRVNNDARADVCGRGITGIWCANWNNATGLFDSYSNRTSAFSDAALWGTSVNYYGSIRLVDVNGDGKDDVCGRGVSGIECALNNGSGTFASTTTNWINTEFTDALGWNAPEHATTIQFGDIDGDGKVDVCGRGITGLSCALGNGTNKFEHAHIWTNDFSNSGAWNTNPAYYRSIRLADVNGDGKADACGRGADGLFCAFSTGTTFAPVAQVMTVNRYRDLDGWNAERYGTTLQFVKLDGDTHLDVCGRGPNPVNGVGIHCAYAP